MRAEVHKLSAYERFRVGSTVRRTPASRMVVGRAARATHQLGDRSSARGGRCAGNACAAPWHVGCFGDASREEGRRHGGGFDARGRSRMSARCAQRVSVHRVATRGPGDVVRRGRVARRRPRSARRGRGHGQDRGQRLRQRLHPRVRHRRALSICSVRGSASRPARCTSASRSSCPAAPRACCRRISRCSHAARCDEPEATGAPRLAIGIAFTRDFLPHELGRMAQVDATADAVMRAMTEADIALPGRALRADQVSAAHLGQAAGRARGGPRAGHARHLRVDGLLARRVGAGRGQRAGRDRPRQARRCARAARLESVLGRGVDLQRHRARPQRGDRDGRKPLGGESVPHRPRRDGGCDRRGVGGGRAARPRASKAAGATRRAS